MWVANPAEDLWSGTEESFRAAQDLAAKINATTPQAMMGFDDGPPPDLLRKEGNVGIIPIQGQLFSSVPDWVRTVYGVADYPAISKALVDAAQDPEIGAIMLDVDSPGGAVNGIGHVASLIRMVNGVKPVHAHAAGRMASAAYWLGSSAGSLSSEELSEVGSIGVLLAHTEYSKADEKEGVTTTVLRAGKYKALGNPYEPLDPLARAEIQSKLDYTYQKFMGHVAEQRGKPYAMADAMMGQGRVFIGTQALEVGLVDSITTYAEALDKVQAQAKAAVDTRKSLIHNPKKLKEGSLMGKKASLSSRQIAAIASGADAEAITPDLEEVVAPTAEVETPASEAVAPEQEAVEPQAEAPAVQAQEEPAKPEIPDLSPVVAMLQAQLKEKDEATVAARVELTNAQTEMTSMKALFDQLVAIAQGSAQKMYIALGSSGEHVAALSAEQLVAEHTKVTEVFQNKFKVGGVAAASAAGKEAQPKAKVVALENARLNAAKFTSK